MYLLIVVLFIVYGSVRGTDCQDRWVAYQGSCYLFGQDLVHFIEAEHYCRQHGAHLVKVETEEESKFLEDFESTMYNDFWLGMTDETVEGIWRWTVDNSRVEYSDWGHLEGTSHAEDCAIMKEFAWHDYPCTFNFSAVCELPASENINIVG